MRVGWLLALLLFSLFFAELVSAGFWMTLNAAPSYSEENGVVDFQLSLLNSGDETAYDATLELVHPPELASKPAVLNNLGAGETLKRNLSSRLDSPMLSGTHTGVFSLQFHDANGYPIYMVFDSRFVVRVDSTSKVHGLLSSTEVSSAGSSIMSLTLKNADDKPHTVHVSVIAPKSLTLEGGKKTVVVPARGEQVLEYSVTNFMALPQSDLLVLGVLEYDDGGVHYSEVVKGRVSVSEKSDALPLIVAAAAVAIVLGVYSYTRLRK